MDVLASYVRGETSVSEYLTWEVEFTTSSDASIDPDLSGNAARLSLLGQEHLMDLRPLSDFDELVSKLLAEQPTATLNAAGS